MSDEKPKITPIEPNINYYIDHTEQFKDLLETVIYNKEEWSKILDTADVIDLTKLYVLMNFNSYYLTELERRLMFELYIYL